MLCYRVPFKYLRPQDQRQLFFRIFFERLSGSPGHSYWIMVKLLANFQRAGISPYFELPQGAGAAQSRRISGKMGHRLGAMKRTSLGEPNYRPVRVPGLSRGRQAVEGRVPGPGVDGGFANGNGRMAD